MTRTWVDPPSGWLFGFPKIWDDTINPDLKTWLVNEGYPQKEIDNHGEHFFCRFWEEKNEQVSSN
jgi:hypothetical protein